MQMAVPAILAFMSVSSYDLEVSRRKATLDSIARHIRVEYIHTDAGAQEKGERDGGREFGGRPGDVGGAEQMRT